MIGRLKITFLIIFLISIFNNRLEAQIRRSIYSDLKAHKIGDVVTILVNEQTSSANKAETRTSKQNEMGIDNKAGTGFIDFLTGFSASTSSDNQYQGSSQIVTSGQFNASISVRIFKILEDGNFLIKGARVMDVNGEKQVTELTGVVRPQDITSSNTILSSKVADVHIFHKGNGVVEQGHRPGFFTRIINWIF